MMDKPTPPGREGAGQAKDGTSRDDAPSLEGVKSFLRDHPEVLDADPELISLLTPPDFYSGRNVLDMQSFVIDKLRKQAEEGEAKASKVRSALAADALDERRVQMAVMAVAAARSFDQLLEIIIDELPQLLTVQSVVIGIEAPDSNSQLELNAIGSAHADGPVRVLRAGTIDALIGDQAPVAFCEPPTAMKLFNKKSEPIRSCCAARLTFTHSAPSGLLLLGARNSGRFNRALSRNRYAFFARYLEETMRLWLDLPPL